MPEKRQPLKRGGDSDIDAEQASDRFSRKLTFGDHESEARRKTLECQLSAISTRTRTAEDHSPTSIYTVARPNTVVEGRRRDHENRSSRTSATHSGSASWLCYAFPLMEVRCHMRLLLRVFCLLSIAGCSVNGSGRPPVEAPESFLSYDITDGLRCAPASGLLGCLRDHEPVDARVAGIQTKRQGASLCLVIRTKTTCFVDRDWLSYALLGHVRDQLVVVETEATGGYSAIHPS